MRAAARQCFWAFHRQFPSAAGALLDQGLDAARVRILRKEQGLVATPAALDALVPARRYKVVAQASQPSSSSSSSSSKAAAHAHPGAPPPAAAPVDSRAAAAAAAPSGLNSGAMRAGGAAAPAGGARRQSLGPLGLAPGSGPLRVAAPPSHQAGGSSSNSSSNSNSHEEGGSKPPAHRAGAPQRVMPHKPNALPRPGGPSTSAAAAAGADGAEGGHPSSKVSSGGGGGSGGSGRLSMSGPLRVMRQPPGTPRVAKEKEEARPAAPEAEMALETDAAAAAAVAAAAAAPPLYPTSGSGWEVLLRDADSPQWHERLKSLEEVGARLRDFNAAALSEAEATGGDAGALALEQQHGVALSRVVAVLARHLHDGNARVAQAAMDGVGAALALPTPGLVAAAVGPHVDQLLPRILGRTADPKEHLRAAAATALERCKAAVEPGLLCAALARALPEQQGDRQKIMALDALRLALPRAGPTYLLAGPSLSASAARSLLGRLAALLPPSRSPVAVERAAASCLQALQQALDPPAFAHALAALATEPQLAVRRALAAAGAPAPAPTAALEEAAPRPRARSQSLSGGGIPAPPVAPAAPAPTAPVLPPKQPRAMAPAFVGDENSAPAGIGIGGGNNRSTGTGTSGGGGGADASKKAKARTPAATATAAPTPSPSPSPSQQAPEAAAPWALAVLSDGAASPGAKSQALEALAGALARGGPALWERHFGAALHLFLDGVRQWQQREAAVPPASSAPSAAACALLQPVPALGAALAAEAEEEGETVWASAVKKAPGSARGDPAAQALHLSLRGLRYLVRLARRQRQQHGAGAGEYAFDAYLEVTAGRLLDCAATPDYEAFQSAERALALLLPWGVEPTRAFAFLVGAAAAAAADTTAGTTTTTTMPRLLMALRALTKLLPRIPAPTAAAALPSLCPLLVRAVADPEIVVRMTSVACIAALYLVVRDALLPHLHARLRPVHLKLVTIYIKRAAAAAAAAAQPEQQAGQPQAGVVSSSPPPMQPLMSTMVHMPQHVSRPALSEIVYN